MVKIEKKGNYILFTDLVSGISHTALQSEFKIRRNSDSTYDLIYQEKVLHDNKPLNYFVDENSVAFVDETSIYEQTSTSYTISSPLDVTVVNQIDLSTTEASLSSIITELQGIDINTDDIESKINSAISELQANGTLNHSDLLSAISELQGIDANTDGIEASLTSLIAQTTNKQTTATVSSVSVGTGATTLLSLSATRVKSIIYNEGSKDIYIKFGNGATTSDYSMQIAPSEAWEENNYNGEITACTSSGTSTVKVTSL